jgi:hypothetical protein
MNVKTLSMVIAISAIFSLFCYFYGDKRFNSSSTEELNCGASVSLKLVSKDDLYLKANVQIAIHFSDEANKKSYVTEYGDVFAGSNQYAIDRNVRLVFLESKKNGYSEVQREGIDRNATDDLPDDIAQKIFSSQTVFFYKIEKLSSNVWRLSDLRRTILICRAIT